MASLVLLLEAIMIRCQNHDLLSNKVAKETDYKTNHDVGKQRYQGCKWKSTSKEEDAHTWKIAECCISAYGIENRKGV